jgi:hypothetical protein
MPSNLMKKSTAAIRATLPPHLPTRLARTGIDGGGEHTTSDV